MAEISKQALKVDNNQSFPNNNNGAITPAILRAFNVNMIDSMVDELGYNVDSASWNVSISNINAFTSSLQTAFVSTASFNSFTSSINAYTASNNTKWNNAEVATSSLFTSVANLNQFTASQVNAFNELNAWSASAKVSIGALNQASSSLQSFTQSANVSITNLNTTTASLLVETQNLELFSASALVSISNLNASSASQQLSIDSLNSKTGSYATTGSNTFTSANTFTSISASSFISASEFIGNGSKITGITASIALPILDEGIPQGNAFSMNFTGSGISAVVVGGTAVVSVNTPDSGTINNLTASFNAYTASTDLDLAAIHQATASLQSFTASFSTSSLVSTSSFNAYTASNDQRVSSLETNSASVNISISALNTFTASQSTASLVTSIDNLNTFSASALVSISNLNSTTASLNTSASLALVTASFDNGTRNLTFTKGNTTTFSVNIPDVSGSAGTTIFEVVYTGENITKGDPLYISGSQGANPVVYKADAAVPAKMPVTFVSNETIGVGNTTNAIVLGLIEGIDLTGYTAGQSIYVAEGGGWSASLPSGSNSVTQLLGVVTKGGSGGKGLVLNPGPAQLPGLDTGRMWVGNGSNQPTEITTASFATTGSNVFTGDQTLIDAAGNRITLADVSGSLMLVGFPYNSSSLHISASNSGSGNLIFKFNDNTADTIISGSGNIFTNQQAPTAGFKRYIGGNQNIFAGISSVPQISGSMGFSPTTAGNFIAGGAQMRGPVSSSTWTISQNNILGNLIIGTSTTLNAEKLTGGLTMTQNYVAGIVNLIANQSALTGSTTTLTGNNINGTITLNLSSSAVSFLNNTINDIGFVLNNAYFSSSVGLGQSSVQRNTIAGNANTITISGSQATGTINAPGVFDNIIGGGSNILYSDNTNARVSGSLAYHAAARNIVYGNNLIISGNSFTGDLSSLGSAFFGRYNSIDGTKDLTNETIFAVGTGNTTTRKTGFLIDSGSNTFVEGTLNVSGATSLNGNLNITGSLTASLQEGFTYVGNASGLTTTVATSSFGTPIPLGTISSSAQITSLGFVSSSVTASSIVTASVNLNTITFTKGDASTFALTVDTGSGGGGGAAFPFTGDAVITGSLLVSGSSIPDVRVIGNVHITGSLVGQPITLSVASNTASIDMNAGNNFVLTLPSSSVTHIAPSSIIAGQTINLLIKQQVGPATGSITFAPSIFFPSGVDMQATATGSAIDLVSMISFDTTNLMAANVKNLR